jgi:thymidine phosphorylase
MKILIDVKTGNAAFEDNPEELRMVLSKAVDKIVDGETYVNLKDSNGNTVGSFHIVGDY